MNVLQGSRCCLESFKLCWVWRFYWSQLVELLLLSQTHHFAGSAGKLLHGILLQDPQSLQHGQEPTVVRNAHSAVGDPNF
jgi:hypothetical protein